jgi:hypothetical protein
MGLHKLYFLFPSPAFDLLLAGDRVSDAVERLVVNEAMTLVLAAKAIDQVVFVLEDALEESCGDASVQCPAGSAGHNVDVRLLVHAKNHKVLQGYSRADESARS